MRAFVTGGAGFLGRRLVARLREQGHDVVCLLRARSRADVLGGAAEHASSVSLGTIEIVRGTLARPDTYQRALAGCDVVFHLAAEMRGAVPVMFMTNVIATRAFLEAACLAEVRRVVLVSSFGVYGAGALKRNAVLDESCPIDPQPHLRDGYSHSKIVQERIAWECRHARELPLVVVRPGVIYGPGRDWVSSRVGLRLGDTVLKMGGSQLVPYTYVDNCADAISCAGTVAGIDGEAFNIVDDHLPTANQLVRRHKADVGPLRVITVPAWAIQPLSRAVLWYHDYSSGQLPAVLTPYRSASHWTSLRYSNEKAKKILGWTPRLSIAEGLALTAASLRSTAERQ